MHKDELGKTDRCQHSRNSAAGKRGHNKRVRKAVKSGIGADVHSVGAATKKKQRKRFGIESRWKPEYFDASSWLSRNNKQNEWCASNWYETAKQRDTALKVMQRGGGIWEKHREFRACERD